jgi:hypothetical protein
VAGTPTADVDLLRAEAAFIGPPPAWLLDRFDCASPSVACGEDSDASDFAGGAYLFLERAAGPPPADGEHRVAFLLALQNEVTAFRRGGDAPYGGASRVFLIRRGADRALEARRSQGDAFLDWPTAARSLWTGNDVYLLVPDTEIPDVPLGWDVVLLIDDGSGTAVSRDSLRADWDAPLHAWEVNASVFIDDYRDFPG